MGAVQGQVSAWLRSTMVALMGAQHGAGGLRLVPVVPHVVVEERKGEERSERGSSLR